MSESTAIEKLAENALETRFENFTKETLEITTYRIIDTRGCLIGGATDTGNPELLKLIRENDGKKEATILVHGGKAPVADAAFINCIMARSFDFGPVSPLVDGVSCPGHISETTVPAALTLAEAVNAGGKEFITALLVGDDTAARILAASGFGFSLGWDGVGTVNTFGGHASDALNMVVVALKKLPEGQDIAKSRAQVRDEIEKIKDFVGVSGVFTMSPQDHLGMKPGSLAMIKIVDGKWTWVQ
jgi:hypothetical protein